MASDILSEMQSHPQPLRMRQRIDSQGSSQGRWWKRGLIATGVVAVVASAAALIPGASSSREFGPALTHTITRGDLLVTVTEQGTLESSNNTDIKCKVRGDNIITWVIESGTQVKPGDELVRLDTLFIEEQISERTKYAHLARSAAARSKATMERAELAISEYLEGRYVSQLATLEKDLAIAESKLRTAKNMLGHAKMMSESGYVSELEVDEKVFAVTRAKLDVEVQGIQIDVLRRFTKAEELVTLAGDLNAAKAEHEADKERAYADELRLKRAEGELAHCVVKAERRGMVIYPTGEAWKNAPDIEEGAIVHKDQVLLQMPDLSNMHVKVGIHESIIDRITPGLSATVTLPGKTLEGKVASVASITRPAGWWTGNVVKYDTIIELPSTEGLKPGMSAEVEVIMARHENVLLIPAGAVVETQQGYACWVETGEGTQRRTLRLGDSSDMFIVVKAGLKEGDEVVLNPLAFIEETQTEAAKTLDETKPRKPDLSEF
jgi:multidrug efflux pump subunit AcrA (membrane-fusion protein)